MQENELLTFCEWEPIYSVLANSSVSKTELVDLIMKKLGKAKTFAYDRVNEFKQGENMLIKYENELFSLDRDVYRDYRNMIVQQYFGDEIDDYLEEIYTLKAQKSDLLSHYLDVLEAENVIVKETIGVEDQGIDPDDTFLIPKTGFTEYELKVMRDQSEWTRESFFREMKDVNLEEEPDGCVELNRDNNMTRGFIKTFTRSLFKKRYEDTVIYKEMVDKTGNKDAVDEVVDKRKQAASIDISTLKNLSNSQKIALYCCMGRYKNTEMESLLNLAGNKCIDADFLISILENGEELNNYTSMRDFIRQMSKPSEVALKQQFAEELIKGMWYIVSECDGVKRKYQLMPVDEYNYLKEVVSRDMNVDFDEYNKNLKSEGTPEATDNNDDISPEEEEIDDSWSNKFDEKANGDEL